MTITSNLDSQPMALEDLVVIDLTDEKGMYMGKMMADMGARVTIVEPPSGHPARHIGPFYQDKPDPNNSLLFWYHSTNKESVTLDITTGRGAQILREMVKKADVLLESFQPGYLESLGLGYEELSKINPRLVMTSLSPFGQTGPYRDMKASDLVSMAMGGIMASCGYDHIEDAPANRQRRLDGLRHGLQLWGHGHHDRRCVPGLHGPGPVGGRLHPRVPLVHDRGRHAQLVLRPEGAHPPDGAPPRPHAHAVDPVHQLRWQARKRVRHTAKVARPVEPHGELDGRKGDGGGFSRTRSTGR